MKPVIFWSTELCQQYLTNLEYLTVVMKDAGNGTSKYFAYFPGSLGGVEIGEGEYERLFTLIYEQTNSPADS